MKKIGTKYDDGKDRWHLLPLDVMSDVVKVLMFGEKKYGAENWKLVRPPVRYYNACIRHLAAYQRGEKFDSETGLPHLSHAICCLIFLSWFNRKD